MPIVINTNLPALRAHNALIKSGRNIDKSMLRLTTGYRINSAADDPAGYCCASMLASELMSSKVVQQNIQTGVNMLQTAESDLSSINTQLERIKDLATQAANGTISDTERNAIKMEAQQRVDEIERLVKKSEFNGVKLLDGSNDGARLQVGTGSDSTVNSININDVFLNATTGQDGIKLFGTGAGQFADIAAAFENADSSAQFIDVVQNSADIVTKRISTAGAYESRLTSVSDNLIVRTENISAAYSTIMDADISEETSNYVKNQILQQTSSSLLIQATQTNGAMMLNLINSLHVV